MIPVRAPGQDFDEHQREIARWMGASSVEAMNAVHDDLHATICRLAGVESHALGDARGEALDAWERHIASLEEEAVLHLQRWMTQIKVGAAK